MLGTIWRFGYRKASILIEELEARIREPTWPRLTGTEAPTDTGSFRNAWREVLESYFPLPSAKELDRLLKVHSQSTSARIRKEAQGYQAHIADVLGSGPVDLGDSIDWQSDFKNGYCFSRSRYFRRIQAAKWPGGYDIKVPWELSRCQHWVRLGQAYYLTGDESFPTELVAQWQSWIEENPWKFGVNWTSSMEAAIRVVNWLWALRLIIDSPALDGRMLTDILRAVKAHGIFIVENPEGVEEDDRTTNHYIANLVGLLYIGHLAPFIDEAERWAAAAGTSLWNETEKQVNPDGLDYETALPYHAFVTQMLLAAVVVVRRSEKGSVPNRTVMKIRDAVEALCKIMKPDGKVPIIGDQDNGRLWRLGVETDTKDDYHRDFREVLGLGSQVCNIDDVDEAVGDRWGESIWVFGNSLREGTGQDRGRSPARSSGVYGWRFDDSGFYVLRKEDTYLIVDGAKTGTNGKGNHTHDSALSFELHHCGHDLVVDSGCYTYTADWKERIKFRGRNAHNVIVPAKEDDGDGVPDCSAEDEETGDLFRFQRSAEPEVQEWDCDRTRGRVKLGYRGKAIQHVRDFVFDGSGPTCKIYDRLSGDVTRNYRCRFHLAPSVAVVRTEFRNKVILDVRNGPSITLMIYGENIEDIRTNFTWVSYSYGRRSPSLVLDVVLGAAKSVDLCSVFGRE